MKIKHLVTLIAVSCLLLTNCKADTPKPVALNPPAGPTQAPPPFTTPFPSTVPGRVLSPSVPPTPVPPISRIPSTKTPAWSTKPGWTRYVSINDVYGLAFAPDGTLWALTHAGLVHWDLTTETYTRYLIQARDIAVARDGSLWLATDHGLCHFTDNTADGATCRNYTAADGLIHNTVRTVAVAPDGTVWAGTQVGVSHFTDPAGDTGGDVAWKNYPAPVPTEDLAVAPNGEVWHATTAGVGRYIPSEDAWMTYTQEHGLPHTHANRIAIGPDGEAWANILWYGVYRMDGEEWLAVGDIPGGAVADIAFAVDGTPWIGTVGGTHYLGGSLVYREGNAWTDVTTARALNSIRTVALGPGGVVAAGTNLGLGIYQGGAWHLLRDGPTSDRATTMAVTPDGAAWFGFGDHSVSTPGGGLSRFDGQDWDYFLGDAEVNTLAVAPDGALWAGLGCDVQRFNGAIWETVARCEEDLPPGSVLAIAFTPDGAAWVANGFSLARYDGGTWTIYEKQANSLAVTPDGTIWINGWEGTQDSFYVACYDGESWTTYKTAAAFPGAFTVGAVTDDGRLWGIVPGGGLVSFNGGSWDAAASWQIYPLPEGLSLGNIAAVASDGALWLPEEDSVARFDPSAVLSTGPENNPHELWTVYTKDDGLVGNNSVIAFGSSNEIWFGTTRFQPAEPGAIQPNSLPTFAEPPGRTVTPAPGVPLASVSPASAPQAIDVRWDTSSTALIVRYYSPYTTAGLSGAYDPNYYIPEAQVWGDGRTINAAASPRRMSRQTPR